jgi:hypothetical protein
MGLSALEIAGHIADLKDTDYKNTLAVAVLVELLVDKGVFTREEFALKARELEQASLAEILASRRRKYLGTR